MLDIKFEDITEHWVLVKAHMSRHESWDTYWADSVFPTADLFYPDVNLGYPRIWVARQKHANYPSDSACDDGGPTLPFPLSLLVAGIDDCNSTRPKRPDRFDAWNLGSYDIHQPSQDCYQTITTIQAYQGQTECYWSDTLHFRGWVTAAPNSDPYIDQLGDAAFVPSRPPIF